MEHLINEQRTLLDEAAKIESSAKEQKRDFNTDEQSRLVKIFERDAQINEQLNLTEKALTARANADSRANDMKRKAGQVGKTPTLTTRELEEVDENFNFMRAVNRVAKGLPLEGMDKDIHEEGLHEMSKSTDSFTERAKSFVIPSSIARRAKYARRDMLADGDPTKGGYTIPTEIRGFLDTLENALVLRAAGATFLGGLEGNLEMPRAITGADTDWLGETTQASEGSPTVASTAMTPHRLAKYIDVSNKFLAQTSADASNFIQNYLARKMAVTWEKAALNGTGAAGQPRGILQIPTGTTAGTASVQSFSGGVPSRALLIQMRQLVAKKNAFGMNMKFISNYDVQGILLATAQVAQYPLFLLSDDNKALGTDCLFTNSVPNNFSSTLSGLVFGAFEYLLMPQWGGVEIMVDQITQFGVGKTRIHAATYVDVGIQLPDAFAIAIDVHT